MIDSEHFKPEDLFNTARQQPLAYTLNDVQTLMDKILTLPVPSIPPGDAFLWNLNSLFVTVFSVATVGAAVHLSNLNEVPQPPVDQVVPTNVIVDKPDPVLPGTILPLDTLPEEPKSYHLVFDQKKKEPAPSNPTPKETIKEYGSIRAFKELEPEGKVFADSTWLGSAFDDIYPNLKGITRSFQISADWKTEQLDNLIANVFKLGIEASFEKTDYKNDKLNGFDLKLRYNDTYCVCKVQSIQAQADQTNERGVNFQVEIISNEVPPSNGNPHPKWVVSEEGKCISLALRTELCRSGCQCDDSNTLFTLQVK